MRVKELYTNANLGIFKILSSYNYTFLPSTESDLITALDNMYYYGYSGEKNIAPVYFNIRHLYDLDPDQDQKTMNNLASIINVMYSAKWNKLYNAMVESYNAISNYDMEQVETPDLENASTTENNTFGFDSTSTDGEPRDKKSYVNTTTGTNTTTKVGRDGRVTAQKLLEQELNVRKNLFYELLFKDIDSILALKIYL